MWCLQHGDSISLLVRFWAPIQLFFHRLRHLSLRPPFPLTFLNRACRSTLDLHCQKQTTRQIPSSSRCPWTAAPAQTGLDLKFLRCTVFILLLGSNSGLEDRCSWQCRVSDSYAVDPPPEGYCPVLANRYSQVEQNRFFFTLWHTCCIGCKLLLEPFSRKGSERESLKSQAIIKMPTWYC